MSYQVLLYYKYTHIAEPETYRTEQLALCQRLNLLGRIIVATEGINGTVSGTIEETQAYIEALRSDARTADIGIKIDAADGHCFPKLSIKVRDEIVSLNLGSDDVNPNEVTGTRLSPAEFKAAMENDDVIVLDGRNDYESALGRFRGALCPEVGNFREFPDWIRTHLKDAKDKKILTYCTGGIRCEKLSGFLIQEGFKDVSQLEGGIVTYGKDETVRGDGFEGQCYVFDQRIGVDVAEGVAPVSVCLRCHQPSTRYVNCGFPPCNDQVFLCRECQELAGKFCSDTCRHNRAEMDGLTQQAIS